jgi:hypothetical protein
MEVTAVYSKNDMKQKIITVHGGGNAYSVHSVQAGDTYIEPLLNL